MASEKHILKIAQFAPLGSSFGILLGSFSIVGVVDVDMVDAGRKDLE
jgi:hypothetical protein